MWVCRCGGRSFLSRYRCFHCDRPRAQTAQVVEEWWKSRALEGRVVGLQQPLGVATAHGGGKVHAAQLEGRGAACGSDRGAKATGKGGGKRAVGEKGADEVGKKGGEGMLGGQVPRGGGWGGCYGGNKVVEGGGGGAVRGKGAAAADDSVLDDMRRWPKLGAGESWADASEARDVLEVTRDAEPEVKNVRSRWGQGQREAKGEKSVRGCREGGAG